MTATIVRARTMGESERERVMHAALKKIAALENVRPVPDREGWTPRFYECRKCNRRLRASQPFSHYPDCPIVIAQTALGEADGY